MSFLKDFKEDLSQAVNELVSDEEYLDEKDMVDTMSTADEPEEEMVNTFDDDVDDMVQEEVVASVIDEEPQQTVYDETVYSDVQEEERLAKEIQNIQMTQAQNMQIQANYAMPNRSTDAFGSSGMKNTTDDVAEITAGTVIEGNMSSTGSINMNGKIKGNIACRGKLVVSGTIVGTSQAAEIFTNNARIEGDVASEGSIKVGNGSIVLGNIYATSAVIAGAVKGDIDVKGPVILDASAIVMGNIKSKSVQINNGAVIEGLCSQCYAEVSPSAFFRE